MTIRMVFLIGATGHVGKALMRELAPDHAAGRLNVKVAARSAASRELVASAGLTAAHFDLDAFETFDAALAGVDTIFLLRPYTLRQLMQGKQVIDSARRVGAKAIVTIGAFGNPDTPWPIIGWNFLVESYAERSGMGWTHLRPNYFMDNVLQQRDRASATIFNRITRPVSWIASEDIAAVAAAVIRDPAAHAGKAYPLASFASDISDIADLFTQLSGRKHGVGVTPPEKMMERLLAQGREPEYARALVDYIDAVNAGRVPEIADVFDTVERITGRPATTWKQFLEKRTAEL
jgi:NAD(P)H dehydrogenase (quinone)